MVPFFSRPIEILQTLTKKCENNYEFFDLFWVENLRVRKKLLSLFFLSVNINSFLTVHHCIYSNLSLIVYFTVIGESIHKWMTHFSKKWNFFASIFSHGIRLGIWESGIWTLAAPCNLRPRVAKNIQQKYSQPYSVPLMIYFTNDFIAFSTPIFNPQASRCEAQAKRVMLEMWLRVGKNIIRLST